MITRQKISTITLNNKYTQYFGGYLMYWKLYSELLKQAKTVNKKFNIFKHIYLFVWFCLLKPLGSVFKYVTYTKGTYQIINGQFSNKDLNKSIIYYLLFIPIWYSPSVNFTNEEIENLIIN